MAKVCVQCDKKIGLFKSAIDEIYCSYECRDAGRRDIAVNSQHAVERQAEAERRAREAATRATAAEAQARSDAAVLGTCPKCATAWRLAPPVEPGGLRKGDCTKCGFTAELSSIERCPTCTCMSLIVEAHGARCPRCKFRRS